MNKYNGECYYFTNYSWVTPKEGKQGLSSQSSPLTECGSCAKVVYALVEELNI